jgi:hypothetical protein
VDADRLLLCLKVIPLGKPRELERIYISSLYDCFDPQYPHRNRSMG